MSLSLAVKYRPKTFEDVCSQESIITILQQQIDSKEWKQAYIFTGPAGCGKTTCARILANEINNHQGNSIEIDAASNNGIEDVRNIINQAKTKPLDCEYKVVILDEIHALSSSAWSALLKLIEEPPKHFVFIGCTTDIQKVPKTILSRCQRFDFSKIPLDIIIDRLHYVLQEEGYGFKDKVDDESLEIIAKMSDGGMRDSLTMLDKCLAYSTDLTLENVVKALGTTDYETMFDLLEYLLHLDTKQAIMKIEEIHNTGKDLKLFVHTFVGFLLDMCKLSIDCDWKYVSIPHLKEYEKIINGFTDSDWSRLSLLLKEFIKLDTSIKYSSTPKIDIECAIIGVC